MPELRPSRLGQVTIPAVVANTVIAHRNAAPLTEQGVHDMLVLRLIYPADHTRLTPYGLALAEVLPPQPVSAKGYRLDLRALISAMPEKVQVWLRSEPPLVDDFRGGRFLAWLGVLVPLPLVDGQYVLTDIGERVLEGAGADDTYANDMALRSAYEGGFTPEQRGVLERLRVQEWDKPGGYDGRVLKGIGPYFMNIVTPHPSAREMIRLDPAWKPFVNAMLDRTATNAVDLLALMPEDDLTWFLTEFKHPRTCRRDSLFKRMGWINIPRKDSPALSSLGVHVRKDAMKRIDDGTFVRGTPVAAVDSADEFDIVGASAAPEGASPQDQEAWDII